MHFIRPVCRRFFQLFAVAVLMAAPSAYAQLQVTEIMIDTFGANDNAWEWIEVRNTGVSAVDLNGAYAAKLGGGPADGPVVDSSAMNTLIPAGGVAVIYDANLGTGNPSNFNDQQFRDAWGLGAGVPVIGAALLPALSNSGDFQNFAFWANQTDYEANLVIDPETDQFVVGSLNNTLFDLNYSPDNMFPADSPGTSLRWSGNGSYQTGTQWASSEVGQPGVVTSVEVSVAGNTNSPQDVGNPGEVPAGPAASGLLISEIMYNPRSPENSAEWEWVEIYNNTGATIDFGATPYIFDDDDGGALDAPNITAGTVATGSPAVLYNSDEISFLDIQGAWDPNGTKGTNFIGVSQWPGFANGGDLVALWDDLAQYTADEGAETTTNAVVAVEYDDNPVDLENPWPQDDGNGSIYLTDLNADAYVGASWSMRFPGDGISFNATALSGQVVIHPGGDIGSPGSFTPEGGSLPGDYDNDGLVGQGDLDLVLLNWGANAPPVPGGWVNEQPSGLIGQTQLDGVLLNWGDTLAPIAANAVPEPTTLVLLGLSVALLPMARRQRS